GNQVPHVHWHVIPRFSNDAHFPLPIWAPRQRTVSEAMLSSRRAQATLLREAVRVAPGNPVALHKLALCVKEQARFQ
ncbi:hypothetical protein QWU86_12095, partial [Neisseria gonorrhoeae]